MDERDARMFAILGLDQDEFRGCMTSTEELSMQKFVDIAPQMATEHKDMAFYRVSDDTSIACVNWRGKKFISGTDIVRYLSHRYQLYTGQLPLNVKKFEEGIFSDLRRLQAPQDCQLETTRSDFLVHLFNADRVRSKKKQKVFYWSSFARCSNALFCDAMERELARIEMAHAAGMSIDEFIKSGIVPTGGSATSGADQRGGPNDWTVQRLQQANDGFRVQSLDQIHIIRNDIVSCLTRHLRTPLSKRKQVITAEMEEAVQEECSRRTGGAQISTLSLGASASESGMGDSFDDEEDSEMVASPFPAKRRRAPRPSGLSRTSAGGASNSTARAVKGRAGPTPATSKRTTPVLDPMYAPEEDYTASTLSSDDDDDDDQDRLSSMAIGSGYHRAPTPPRRPFDSRHHMLRYSIWTNKSHPASVIPTNYAYPPLPAGMELCDSLQSPIEYCPPLHVSFRTTAPAKLMEPTEDVIGGMLFLSSPQKRQPPMSEISAALKRFSAEAAAGLSPQAKRIKETSSMVASVNVVCPPTPPQETLQRPRAVPNAPADISGAAMLLMGMRQA